MPDETDIERERREAQERKAAEVAAERAKTETQEDVPAEEVPEGVKVTPTPGGVWTPDGTDAGKSGKRGKNDDALRTDDKPDAEPEEDA